MPEFRPDNFPAQPEQPNAVCRDCGWLREVIWAAPAPPCPNCGDDRVDRIDGRTRFSCPCGGLRLDYYSPCPLCRAEQPAREVAPAPVSLATDKRGAGRRKVKSFLHVTFAATVERSIEKSKKKPPAG